MKKFLSLVVTLMLMIKCTYADEMAPEVESIFSSNEGSIIFVCIGVAVIIVLSAVVGIVVANKIPKNDED